MKLTVPQDVKAAIRTLGASDRRKVAAWFDHLEHWESDPQVRQMSKATGHDDVYALTTSDDLRIFFKVDSLNETVVIVGISRPSRFETQHATSV